MQPTKQKILQTAIDLYNQKGVSNVTLRDIAAGAGISPGNLAYHYRNHDYLIEEAFRQMEKEREEILTGVQQIPSFDNINRQILPLLHMARKYLFFHLDAVHLLRAYPQIAALQREYFENSINYIKAVIDHSVGAGSIRPEQQAGQYQRLAHTVWMLMTCWLEQLTLRGLPGLDIEELRRSVWDLVIPHLTEKGKHQFLAIDRVKEGISE